MTCRTSKRRLLAGASAFVMLTIVAAQAQQRNFSIPSEDAVKAIPEFARQAGIQIVSSADQLSGVKTVAVSGALDTHAALKMLLLGTGIEVASDDGQTIVLKAAPKNVQAASNDGAASNSSVAGIESVVVTGTNIRGITPESSPLFTYSQAEMKAMGSSTLEDFFDLLPQNFNTLRSVGTLGTAGASNNGSGTNGIDLRGLGVGTTLVLVDGRPLAPQSTGRTPDISLIPLGIVDHVDVLTDGASAIYGSEAVGGVVNLVLRNNFEGVETTVNYGTATSGGHDQKQIEQAFGHDWGTGHAFLSLGYSATTPLDAADRSYAAGAGQFTLIPQDIRESVFANIDQSITSALSVYGEVLYSHRENKTDSNLDNLGIPPTFENKFANTDGDLFLNGGAKYAVTDSIHLELTATYTAGTQDGNSVEEKTPPLLATTFQGSHVLDLLGKADGAIFQLPGGPVRFAVGGGYTQEDYSAKTISNNGSTTTISGTALSRTTADGFGELYFPIIGADQNIPGINRLTLDVASRYTHYSDFGNNVSSKVGVLWSPVPSLAARATWSQSFRAPYLAELYPTSNSWALVPVSFFSPVQTQFGLPASAGLMYMAGNNPNVGPEKAATETAGVDFTPEFLPGFKGSITYFNIDYADQIGTADPSLSALSKPALFPSLFTLNPSAAQIAAIIAGAPPPFLNFTAANPASAASIASVTKVLLDERTANLAVSRESGVDISAQYSWDRFSIGTQLSKLIHFRQQVTASSPILSVMDNVGEPASFRAQNYASFTQGAWSARVGVNYIGSYTDTNTTTPAKVSSWTTVDLSGAWRSDSADGFDHGLRASLYARNIFDQNPPFVAISATTNLGLVEPIGFDPTNANPVGRFIGFEITKDF